MIWNFEYGFIVWICIVFGCFKNRYRFDQFIDTIHLNGIAAVYPIHDCNENAIKIPVIFVNISIAYTK